MKRFIKALEDKGIMENLVDSGVSTEKMTGASVRQQGMELILQYEMMKDEDLEDIFLQEAHAIAMESVFEHVKKQIDERHKVEVMEDVDVDALFAKATGKTPFREDLDGKIEEMLLNSLSRVLDDVLSDVLKSKF